MLKHNENIKMYKLFASTNKNAEIFQRKSMKQWEY